MNNKSFTVSNGQFFFIMFTVRLYSLLLNTGSLSDFALYFTVTYVMCLTADFLKKHIYGKRINLLLLAVISFLLTVQTVISYVMFTAQAVHPDFSTTLLIFIILVSVVYSASLGTEAIARFASVCGPVLILSVVIGFIFNLSSFDISYISALSFNVKADLYSTIKCFDLPVLNVLLSPYVKGNAYKTMNYSVAASYLLSGILLIYSFGVMGTAQNVYPYPAFMLFRMATINELTRLDIVFTSALILALFLKCSILLNVCRAVLRGDYNKKVIGSD